MSTNDNGARGRLAIEIEPELSKRIEIAAAEKGVSLRDDVVAALGTALASDRGRRPTTDSEDWSTLSVPVFARDWESDADAIYDDLA